MGPHPNCELQRVGSELGLGSWQGCITKVRYFLPWGKSPREGLGLGLGQCCVHSTDDVN